MGVEDVSAKVQRILIDHQGTVEAGRDNTFWLYEESAVGRVRVSDWGNDDAIVDVGSAVLRHVPLTPALYEWVATEGQGFIFGHYRVIAESDAPGFGLLVFEHNLLGSTLDVDELMYAVTFVMREANRSDEELKAKFGGLLGSDSSGD